MTAWWCFPKGRIIVEGSPEQVVTKAMLSEVFTVSAEVDTHPASGCPRITYAYPLPRREYGHEPESAILGFALQCWAC